MFNFGLFSTHLPYLIMVLLYVVYYVSTLLGGNVSLSQTENKTGSQMAHEIAYQSVAKKDVATYRVCFAKNISLKKGIKPIAVRHTNKRIILRAQPVLECKYGYSLFSRPPPSKVIA